MAKVPSVPSRDAHIFRNDAPDAIAGWIFDAASEPPCLSGLSLFRAGFDLLNSQLHRTSERGHPALRSKRSNALEYT